MQGIGDGTILTQSTLTQSTLTQPTSKRVLVIAGEYPPIKTIGRIRTAKFVEHLRDLGWRPIVITIDYESSNPSYYSELEAEIPTDVEVHRVRHQGIDDLILGGIKRLLRRLKPGRDRPRVAQLTGAAAFDPAANTASTRTHTSTRSDRLINRFKQFVRNWIHIPDDYLLWGFAAYFRARRICKEQHIDLIYTSLPPFSSAIAGCLLKRRTGIPWVVDYRDLWIGDVLREWLPPARSKFEVWLEKKLLPHADAVVAVSEPKTDFLRQHLGGQRIWETITNGYDSESFDYLLDRPRPVRDTLDFVYAGRLFKNRRGYALLHALGELVAADASLRQRLRFHFYGAIEPVIFAEYQRLIGLYELETILCFHGDVDYETSKRVQVDADYLLLIVDTGATTDGVIPGKVFEYVAAKRPILALCDSKATREIIEKANIGQVVGTQDQAGCKEALAQILLKDSHELRDVDHAYLSQFERRTLSKRLAALFDRLT
ncbi:MAG: glycosyltransferase involved in cell wall biosynthesis [Motiliproteus sp.]|jgi:glycosyltransferase involved in cell wall biosynthesis